MSGVSSALNVRLGSDHAGRTLRDAVASHLTDRGITVSVYGPNESGSVDYPDVAHPLTEWVLGASDRRVVLVCGTGQGMAMTANARPKVRAALVSDTFSARMAALHNDAQVLCLGERVVGTGVALDCVDAWLDASFEGGRHARRVSKIEVSVR